MPSISLPSGERGSFLSLILSLGVLKATSHLADVSLVKDNLETFLSTLQSVKDLTARIAILETRPQYRQLILKSLSHNGFSHFSHAKTLEDLPTELPTSKKIHWILLVIDSQNPWSQLDELEQWLKNVETWPQVSCLVASGFEAGLPKAYEFGVLSHHSHFGHVEALAREWQVLLKIIDQCRMSGTYVAATYLRLALKELNLPEERLNLEAHLMHDFKKHRANHFEYAEALFQCGDYEQAARYLERGVYFYPQALDRARELKATYLKDQLEIKSSFAFQYDIQWALLVSESRELVVTLEDMLKKFGLTHVQVCRTTDQALKTYQALGTPGLSVVDWRVTGKVDALALIERLRYGQDSLRPILVLGVQLPKEALQRLRELEVSQVLTTPFHPKKLLMAMGWSCVQAERPSEAKTIERRIVLDLRLQEFSEAYALFERFQKLSGRPLERQYFLDALFSLVAGEEENALLKLEEALRLEVILHADTRTFLGKLYLQRGESRRAIELLHPFLDEPLPLIEPVCLAILCALDIGDLASAKRWLKAVELRDAHHPLVMEQALIMGMLEEKIPWVEMYLAQHEQQDILFGKVNQLAINRALRDSLAKAQKLWQVALSYLDPDEKRAQSYGLLNFNLALCHLKNKDHDKAKVYLDRVIRISQELPCQLKERSQKLLASPEGQESFQAVPYPFAPYFLTDPTRLRHRKVLEMGLRGAYQVSLGEGKQKAKGA